MTKRAQKLWASAVTLAIVLIGALPAQAGKVVHPGPGERGEWQLIGRTEADHGADHDATIVKGPFDDFRRITSKVTDAPLNMQHMVVTYDNGRSDRINVREHIVGTCARRRRHRDS